MGWYDELTSPDQTLARGSPAGLAVVHTSPFAQDSGQRWIMFPYMDLIAEVTMPVLTEGGKAMLFMPPRHGKSLYCSVYAAAWFVMHHATKNVILTSYSGDLCAHFSKRARSVVRDLGHLFGCRVHPEKHSADNWQIQLIDQDGSWRDGGEVFAAGVDGPLPGRGGHLIVLDDVVRGHRDTTTTLMQKAYSWYRSVLETRLEPKGAILLVMTRWAMADLAGRLLEDERDEWDVLTLPALAKDDDPIGREVGEALCPSRYDKAWLERKRDSSDEGGMIFSALYQQDPIPDGGILFKPEQLLRWEGREDAVVFGNVTAPISSLKLWFATIDPALKEKEVHDPTGFLVWAIATGGELLLMERHSARMRGSDDLIPLMKRVRDDHPGIDFFVEDQAHGTEIIRACIREGLRVQELKADRDKVVRWIGAQPAFAAGKVFLPARGAENVVREMLENPGAKHDDDMDCVAYAVQVWRDRVRWLGGMVPIGIPPDPDEDEDDDDGWAVVDTDKDERGNWRP